MQKLKFRVWYKYSYIELSDLRGNRSIYFSPYDLGIIAQGIDRKEVELEQYTGLKDKNGKEIYEGDILQDESNDTAVVIWREHQAEWGIKWIHMGIEDSLSHRMEWGHLNEIIGNIHENPELLEQEDGEK